MKTYIAVLIAINLQLIVFKIMGHLLWPKWKAYLRIVVYITISAVGFYLIGYLVYIYIFGYQLYGLLFHIFWCKRHHLNWIKTDKEKYIQSQKDYFETLKQLKAKHQRK